MESPKGFDKKMWFSHGKWEGNNKNDVPRMRNRLNKKITEDFDLTS